MPDRTRHDRREGLNVGLQLRRRSKIDVLLLLLVGVAGFFVVKHAIAVGDWLHSLYYHPGPQIVRLADAAGMNDEGKKLFYRFSPQLVNASVLKRECGSDKLGCTAGRHIYILNSDDPAQYNRNIVTAAHEMLHVAYSRLDRTDKQSVDSAIDNLLASDGGRVVTGITEQLNTYDKADYYNEAHSYIGSELSDAGPALNTYYERYFDDRAKTTQAFLNSPEGR